MKEQIANILISLIIIEFITSKNYPHAEKYLSTFLSLLVFFLLFTACEKEAIQSAPEVAVLSETEQASRYLNSTTTELPFAVLEIDHSINQVAGF